MLHGSKCLIRSSHQNHLRRSTLQLLSQLLSMEPECENSPQMNLRYTPSKDPMRSSLFPGSLHGHGRGMGTEKESNLVI